LNSEERDGKEKDPTHQRVNLGIKDYVALTIAMAETTMLPMILLAIVLVAVSLTIVLFFLH
jgi:preprotein translocase subunit SecF